MVCLRQGRLEGDLLRYLRCFFPLSRCACFKNCVSRGGFYYSPCDEQAGIRSKSSEALACHRSLEGHKKQKRLPSYSMNTNMLPSIGQPNRVIRRNACHDTCMSRMCCFEVASGSCSSQSWACCRRLEHRDLYILFARPPAAASISFTCLADAALM